MGKETEENALTVTIKRLNNPIYIGNLYIQK